MRSTTSPSQPQLRLLDGGRRRPSWTLSEDARAVGRAGVAEARRRLAAAIPADPEQSERRAS